MKIKKTILLICFVFASVVVTKVFAQKNYAEYEGLKWYLDKTEALDSAKAQNKYIFFMWGRTTCTNCNGIKHNLTNDTLKSILEDKYILWFFDYNKCNINNCCAESAVTACDDIRNYVISLSPCGTQTFKYLPAICIIDPSDTVETAHSLTTGYKSVSALYAMLNQYVANENIKSPDVSGQAYISNNRLIVRSRSSNETISVYNITGMLVDRFNKMDETVNRDALDYPAGVLIVTGSSGWSKKIISKF